MTDKIRRRRIQIETHEITIVRRQQTGFVYCSICQAMVGAIRPDDSPALTPKLADDHSAGQNEVHFIDTGDGEAPFTCGSSLEDTNLK